MPDNLDPQVNERPTSLNASKFKTLVPFAKKISKLNALTQKIKNSEDMFHERRKVFFSRDNFPGKNYKYLILGIIGLAVLIFDISIGLDTLHPLARFLGFPVAFFSVIFAIIDTGVSIGASGNLASSPEGRIQARKLYMWILKLLAAIKLGLFIGFMIGSNDIEPISIIMNSLFIIIIYTLFHFTGAGLMYILALIWFNIHAALMVDTITYKSKIDNAKNQFIHRCKQINQDPDDAFKQFNII